MLAKNKLNNLEVLFCKGVINSYISQDELLKVNNVLKEYHDTKEGIKNLKTLTFYQRF